MSASAPVRTTPRHDRSTRGDAARRARLVVVPTLGSSAPRVPFVVLVSMLLVGGVVGLLLFNTSMQQASFAASSLEQQATVLDARQQSLAQQVEDLGDPQRVASSARDLGMVPAPAPAFLDVQRHRVLGTAEPAPAENPLRVADYPSSKPKALHPPVTTVEKPAPPRTQGRRGEWAQERAQERTGDGGREQRAARGGATGRASDDAGREAGTNR